jgi:hypothetical protein
MQQIVLLDMTHAKLLLIYDSYKLVEMLKIVNVSVI